MPTAIPILPPPTENTAAFLHPSNTYSAIFGVNAATTGISLKVGVEALASKVTFSIPREGTLAGFPVTGDIEMASSKGWKWLNPDNSLGASFNAIINFVNNLYNLVFYSQGFIKFQAQRGFDIGTVEKAIMSASTSPGVETVDFHAQTRTTLTLAQYQAITDPNIFLPKHYADTRYMPLNGGDNVDRIEAHFEPGAPLTHAILITSLSAGTYTSLEANNITNLTYTKNGTAVTLPFTLAQGETFGFTRTLQDATKRSYFILSSAS